MSTPKTSKLLSVFEAHLAPGERVLSTISDLRFYVEYIPNIRPWWPGIYEGRLSSPGGVLALTTARLVAIYEHSGEIAWQSAPRLIGLSERPAYTSRHGLLGVEKPHPYLAAVWLPGAVVLLIGTAREHVERGRQLSSLLTQALQVLRGEEGDEGAIAAVLYEEKRREEEQRQSYDD